MFRHWSEHHPRSSIARFQKQPDGRQPNPSREYVRSFHFSGARRLHSELPSKRLGALCEYYGITNEQAHRAMGDTRATAVLFYHLLAKLEQHHICQPEDVCKFERMQCSSAIRLLEKQKEKMLPRQIMVTKH